MYAMDVIIPVYRPDERFYRLLCALKKQTMPANRIIVYNTEKAYYEEFAKKYPLERKFPELEVYHLSRREFDHGGTRNLAVQKSDAPYFVMMTMDAVPADAKLLEELYWSLSNDKTAVAYARQLPGKDSGGIERYTRAFNYPAQSVVKTKEDLSRLGIKTFFCSNVCAAYKRVVFDELGGFPERAIFNEDMVFAWKAIYAGYGISYAADAKVIHSHEYSIAQQFHRNFDIGISQADHPEVFGSIRSESEGMRLVSGTVRYLLGKRQIAEIPKLFIMSAAKLAGYRLGKIYHRLPRHIVLKCTMNREYFLKTQEGDCICGSDQK